MGVNWNGKRAATIKPSGRQRALTLVVVIGGAYFSGSTEAMACPRESVATLVSHY